MLRDNPAITESSPGRSWYAQCFLIKMDDPEPDEVLGVVRCDRCGHRLENEIECPFCSLFQEPAIKKVLPQTRPFDLGGRTPGNVPRIGALLKNPFSPSRLSM